VDNLYLEPADAGAVLLDDDLLPPSLDDELDELVLESLLPDSLLPEVDDSEDEDVDDDESPFDELLDELLAASRLSVR
jgi:hypothetical protein